MTHRKQLHSYTETSWNVFERISFFPTEEQNNLLKVYVQQYNRRSIVSKGFFPTEEQNRTHVFSDGIHGQRVISIFLGNVVDPARHRGAEEQHLTLPNLCSSSGGRTPRFVSISLIVYCFALTFYSNTQQ